MAPPPTNLQNRLLPLLSAADYGSLELNLEFLDLPLRFVLEEPHKPITHVYFIDRGFASVVAASRTMKRKIEIGLIGREGMSGTAVVMGNHRSPNATYMQAAGSGQRIRTDRFRAAVEASSSLHHLFLRFAQTFMIQTSQTAIANGQSKLEERLARWILMADDRLDGNVLPLTHEFLSLMLGVRRAGVTVALHTLEGRGQIKSARSLITVIDRRALEKTAGESYGVTETEYARLMSMALTESKSRSGRDVLGGA
ncbi:MAG: Crp/Fnr family transcriptional regulator [Alphaproteobacteria bacterium]